eukprot:6861853-Pyramimonas_sp.AAC.1
MPRGSMDQSWKPMYPRGPVNKRTTRGSMDQSQEPAQPRGPFRAPRNSAARFGDVASYLAVMLSRLP